MIIVHILLFWNRVLKEYLLRGYSIYQLLMPMESRIDHRLSEHDNLIKKFTL